MATTILDLPLDAWVVILVHLDRARLAETFEAIFWLLGVPMAYKLDAFWIVVSQARLLEPHRRFDDMPDPQPYIHVCAQLVDMGVPADRALDLSAQADGNFLSALELLGWA